MLLFIVSHCCPTKIGVKSAVILYSKELQPKESLFQNPGEYPLVF